MDVQVSSGRGAGEALKFRASFHSASEPRQSVSFGECSSSAGAG
jgi:hypothetical protein